MNSKNALVNLRHSCAHLLAAAVINLWPDAKPTIGPAIETGFYYDFDFGDAKISEEDLPSIETEMRKILSSWTKFSKRTVEPAAARAIYRDNPYKVELIDEIEKKGERITLCKFGDFEDLCRGGHSKNPAREICAFKLLSIAGAYWRGLEKNKMLTRIYGTAFPDPEELDKFLKALEEARRRDHRRIGQELELFTTSDEVGPGLILWLPKGTIVKEGLETFAKQTELDRNYQRISTPHIAKDKLFYTSGHLPYYAQDMYPPMKSKDGIYYLKPMNCPFMHIVFKSKQRSYKEFPVRFAEFGTVYRYEESGTLFGLMRVRGQTQNDAHIYCSNQEQALQELVDVMKLHEYYFKVLGIKDFYIELALPDFKKKKDKYFDNPKAWKEAVNILRKAAETSRVEVIEDVGGAAFYGPKFDFNIKSVTGRKFSITTNQLDFGSGERFKLTLTDQDGKEKIVPYIVHRAPLGSDERFIGFLIEHFGGSFPLWLSPVQVVILPIADRHRTLAASIIRIIRTNGIRVELDDRQETLNAKIRDATLQKVPYMGIIGDKEVENGTLSVRTRDGKNLGALNISEFTQKVKTEIDKKV